MTTWRDSNWQTRLLMLRQRAAQAAHLGAWPDFIIIGAQRCGTTSLYDYLSQHPSIQPALRKEIHYFDNHFDRSPAWYRAFFYPAALRRPFRPCLTGEATPYYPFHPHTPPRLAATLPRARLIVMLRNPVDRAYSHYLHEVRRGHETLPFAAAVARERERVNIAPATLADPAAYDPAHHHFSYLQRGHYATQLQAWRQHFAPAQMLIIISESFFAQPATTLAAALAFLGAPDPDWRPAQFARRNFHGNYEDIPPALRHQLEAYFASHNRQLAHLLGYDPGW